MGKSCEQTVTSWQLSISFAHSFFFGAWIYFTCFYDLWWVYCETFNECWRRGNLNGSVFCLTWSGDNKILFLAEWLPIRVDGGEERVCVGSAATFLFVRDLLLYFLRWLDQSHSIHAELIYAFYVGAARRSIANQFNHWLTQKNFIENQVEAIICKL